MHAPPPLHPFRRSAVLRGMTKPQTPAVKTLDSRKRYYMADAARGLMIEPLDLGALAAGNVFPLATAIATLVVAGRLCSGVNRPT
jgi:hypothetical protein